ncbi:ATP-binding cassette domain-containing protein [Lachnospiraceae bacterium]|nr:ATP-binding cassette domain-containing protein [Lachnospiraceae bacterium]
MDIIINHLSKKFGEKQVLKDFSLRIKEGTSLTIMAPSGKGKTTLLKILAGLETADEGYIEGLENKKISIVFQEDRLCPALNALDNIRLVCGKEMKGNQIYQELETVGLKGNEKYPIRDLSGGMKRRIAIVRALIVPYDILLLDEPFSGLDIENKRKMINYIKEKNKTRPMILVTHDPWEAETMENQTIFL